MSRNNDVFQVLIPTVAAPAATGTTLDALAQGVIGAFSYGTNLALDPAVTPTEDFYLAIKVKDLDNNDDIVKSAGTHIQYKNIVSYTEKQYTAPTEMVTNNTLKIITSDDEIGVRVEIRNQEAYRLNGYNQVVKTYLVPTTESGDCDSDCFDVNCVAILTSLVDLINSDPDGLFVASQIAPTATDPADACEAGTAGYVAGKLILTASPKALKDFCNINLNYFFPHQTELIVTPLNGFEDTVIATAMVYEDGAGYDVKQLEYEAGGWNGKPGIYRASEAMGVAFEGFQYFSDIAKKYDVWHASYDQKSISGWRSDEFHLRTIVAAEDGAIGVGVKAFLDVIFA